MIFGCSNLSSGDLDDSKQMAAIGQPLSIHWLTSSAGVNFSTSRSLSKHWCLRKEKTGLNVTVVKK